MKSYPRDFDLMIINMLIVLIYKILTTPTKLRFFFIRNIGQFLNILDVKFQICQEERGAML